jgi:hypothetical protein
VKPVLHDAVLLNNFAAANALHILQARHGGRPSPRWVAEVHSEVLVGSRNGIKDCQSVIASDWLDEPFESSEAEMKAILMLRTALGNQHPKDLGEASSIYRAQQTGGSFATDDNAAYAFAVRRLGNNRATDTVSILTEAVAMDDTTKVAAAAMCEAIRSAKPEPRSLRRVHPDPLLPNHFDS